MLTHLFLLFSSLPDFSSSWCPNCWIFEHLMSQWSIPVASSSSISTKFSFLSLPHQKKFTRAAYLVYFPLTRWRSLL